MPAFKSISEITTWWKENARGRRVSVLFDCTEIGQGIQRREILHDGRSWLIGFSRS